MAEEEAAPSPDGETGGHGAGGRHALLLTLVLPLLIAGAGLLTGHFWTMEAQAGGGLYGHLTAGLLAVGLYGSAGGVGRPESRGDVYRIVVAITFGVGVKAAFIAGVLWLAFRGEPEYLVLAVAMAQIDPLSVSAMLESRDMSPRAKSLLAAWASFDDPVTTVLVVILGSMVLTDAGSISSGATSYAQTLAGNAVLLVVAAGLWLVVRQPRARRDEPVGPRRAAVQIAVLVALLAVATWQFLMLGLAVSALFFRPPLGRWLGRATNAALWVATFLLGMLLAEGADFSVGVVLGVATFVAQGVVGAVVTLGFPARDRHSLCLSQQNGITAIILALLLEPALPEAVAVIAPAILVVNLLHLTSNAVLARVRLGRERLARVTDVLITVRDTEQDRASGGTGREPPTPSVHR
ncbi:hypothetical protein [Streptomyces justiciae]|uniref:Cation/H+ exchanger domain-containing protein n=1 Tax=Streptomyces justiciae TaxID=2780140 RepID=A0ABU3M3R6_9ACTN|nr:hypothetical protein [Streptomyces justiciae]MDT7846141.1 hypothetical protein [Streptomyces justiciae]